MIDDELEIDSHHKSYEGTLSINFKNRFEYDDNNPEIYIYLSCYIAPLNGRGDSFDSQDELDKFITYWETELKERKQDEDNSH